MTTSIHTLEKSKLCATCNQSFNYVRATAKYCSDLCRVTKSRSCTPAKQTAKKPRKSKLHHFINSTYGLYLVRQLRRSGTVQVVPKSTSIEDLRNLWELYQLRGKANGTGAYRTEEFDLCHLASCIGKDGRLGILHPSNIIVASSSVNKSLGNKPTVYSSLPQLSISSKTLLSKWKIKQGESAKSILDKLDKWLGGTLQEYQKQYNHKEYIKTKLSEESTFKGREPASPVYVMKETLNHLYKYHGNLMFDKLGFPVVVGSSIVPKKSSDRRWNIPESDSYRYLLTGKFEFKESMVVAANDDEGEFYEEDETYDFNSDPWFFSDAA